MSNTEEIKNYLNMSDEALMEMGPPDTVEDINRDLEDTVTPNASESNINTTDVTNDDDDDDADQEVETEEEENDDDADDSGNVGDSDLLATDTDEAPEAEGAQRRTAKGGEEVSTESNKEKTDTTTQTVDYEKEYKRILAPFKANGREISVKSVDDAVTLMQMGANYNKKMAALKPNLKLMKLLENNGLLTEDKISFLIDLEKKNPEAINKLVSDSGIDPIDLDAEKAGTYKQSTYTVDDREIELDNVLGDMENTPTYAKTLDIVSTKWDSASKQTVANTPQILRIVNDHVSSGIYDIIAKEMESERVFGRLEGLSDIEAYRQVGDAIQARGGFNHLNLGSSQPQGQPPTKPVVVAPPPKKRNDDRLKDKRRAAGSTTPTNTSKNTSDFNPLALSDAEFSKQVNEKFL